MSKKLGKYMNCYEYRNLNTYIVSKNFKMETSSAKFDPELVLVFPLPLFEENLDCLKYL
jgi:hypothetical protein